MKNITFSADPTLIHKAKEDKKASKAFGFHGSFYTGDPANSITPPYGGGLSFQVNKHFGYAFAIKHRFGLEGFGVGENFANEFGTYYGFAGTYDLHFKFLFSKSRFKPFLSFGPNIGMFVIVLNSGDEDTSANQSAFKYGYSISTGFDAIKKTMGFGIEVTYFKFLPSTAVFEFPAASVSAQGVRLNFKILFGYP